jgi:hypothetical protein
MRGNKIPEVIRQFNQEELHNNRFNSYFCNLWVLVGAIAASSCSRVIIPKKILI